MWCRYAPSERAVQPGTEGSAGKLAGSCAAHASQRGSHPAAAHHPAAAKSACSPQDQQHSTGVPTGMSDEYSIGYEMGVMVRI